MRNLTVALLVLTLAGCGAGKATTAKISDLESRNEELSQRLTKLENDLTETKRQLIQHQQAMQTMNDRLKTVEASVDKLAYPTH
jgi:outer membrane murein-binding lipoprotein Lpp